MTKEKRGRYGDGCVYQNRRLWWYSRYEEIRHADGTTERPRKFKSSGSTDKKVALKLLRAKLQAIGGRRPTVADPEKVTYNDVMENYFAYYKDKNLRSLRRNREGELTLGTFKRLNDQFNGWLASQITITHLKDFRKECEHARPSQCL